jgi:eukaryotic-like serine/threonine-protein kinase
MGITIGTHLGTHEIIALLGKGGMGEVYRARDLKLKREIAIKILPDDFSSDADRVSRFQREAEVLASLNHPNIAQIYGLEESDQARCILMELVEGETLADRLKRGPISIEETLKIALQIADALEAAHDKGIIHRDLKPANVKITPDGKVKVLDFGLAKATESAPANAGMSHSPTLSMAATNAGVILGTAAYMSPEQANGFPADQRSDVFSFGCVFYEMLTGRQPFQGRTISEVMASVLVREPDWTLIPANLNPRIHELIRRCLEKDARGRWQAAGDMRVEIERLISDPAGMVSLPQQAAKPRPLWKGAIPVLVTAIVVGVIASIAAWNLKPPAPAAVTRFPLALPEAQNFSRTGRQFLAISRDGAKLVYVANNQLFLRQMSEMQPRPIPGADGDVANPFFSPDGQWIGFWSAHDTAIKKIALAGGASITICKADVPYGASWDGGTIVFSTGKGIMRVSANGGEPEVLVAGNSSELIHGPQILDHGRAVLFTVTTAQSPDRWDQAQIVVQSLPLKERKVLVRGGSDARYVSSGHIIYALSGNILAIPFDLKKLDVQGGPVPVIEGVMRAASSATAAAQLSFSENGTLVYVPGSSQASSERTLAIVDRSGKAEPLPLAPAAYDHPRISPDGKRIVVETDDGKGQILWVYEISGGTTLRRLTFGGNNSNPIWSQDGRYVLFTSDREGDNGLFRQPADGTGSAERLTKPEKGVSHFAQSIDPSGKTLAFFTGRGSNGGIWMLALDGDRKARQFVELPDSTQVHASFSPDGRWVAYTSTEINGNAYIFVQPYPATGAKYQVTTELGAVPLWSPDGKQIFYWSAGKIFSIDVRTEPSFSFGKPAPLPLPPVRQIVPGFRSYDITPDGQRFIMVMSGAPTAGQTFAAPQIDVVLNWFEELKQRVPLR